MTAVEPHDVLCPNPLAAKTSCHCDLIARVREDERERMNRALDIAVVKHLMQEEYAAALRDAVEAVKALNEAKGYDMPAEFYSERDDGYAEGWVDLLSEVFAAIEALGGER